MPDQATCQARFEKSLQYYLDKGEKIEDMRDDIRYRPLAIELGYTVIYGACFGDGLVFDKEGKKRIWSTPYMQKNLLYEQWTCADIINNYHRNHRRYPSLEEALRKEA